MAEESVIKTKFLVAGMDCGDEVTAIKAVLSCPKIFSVDANIMSATVEIKHDPSVTREFLKDKIESAGVKVSEVADERPHLVDRNRFLRVAASGVFLGLGFLTPLLTDLNFLPIIAFVCATILSGTLIFPKALNAVKQRHLDMNVLMTVAVIGAFVVKEYSEAATVVFLFSVAELLEAYSVARARKAILTIAACRFQARAGLHNEFKKQEFKSHEFKAKS